VNEAGPQCRRCRADLSLLFAVETDRSERLARAAESLRTGRPAEALAAIGEAEGLRKGDDVLRLKAAARLAARDFAGALAAYHELANASPRPTP
jgi:hypothetical protein